MENFDICFRDSSRNIIDKISFCSSYRDALKMLRLMTLGYSEKICPVYAELNTGGKHIAFYEMTIR